MKECSMADKWFSKLTKDVGMAAADMPDPTDAIIKLPSPSLNYLVGNGGITRGKAVCFYGPESAGKSLIAQLTAAQLLRDEPNGYFIWFDSEYSFNKKWFQKLSGFSDEDMKRMIVRQTNDPLKIFDYIYGEMLEMVQDGCPVVGIGIDSVKNIKYPKDMKSESTKQVMGGGGASYLGSALKHITPVIREHCITTLLVQQVYEEMDEYKKMLNPFKIPDGMALKHFCDYMLEVTRVDTKAGRVEEGKDLYGSNQQIGHKVRVRGKKNRLGAPYRTALFTLSYTDGIINIPEEVFGLAKSLNIVYHPTNPDTGKTNSQMWQFNDVSIRGEANFLNRLYEDAGLLEDIITACGKVDSDEIIAASSAAIEKNIGDIEVDLGAL